MNSEPKAFASLSSGLLARKGAARPAMRPQGFGQMGNGLDDLGWNDMGFEAPQPALVPVRDDSHDAFGEAIAGPALRNPLAALTPVSPVHSQQAELADRFAGYDLDASDIDEDADETAELFEPEATSVETTETVDAELPPVTAADPSVPVIKLKTKTMAVLSTDADDLATTEPAPVVEAAPVVAVAPVMATPVRPAPRVRAETGAKGKAAFTLRLDPARHLKLRLACAVTGRSAQMLVTDALDQLLGAMPELDSMASAAPAAGKRAGR